MGISFSSKGFGYAILEGSDRLIEWGFASETGIKNKPALKKFKVLVEKCEPDILALQNLDFNRSQKVKALHNEVMTLAAVHSISTAVLRKQQINILLDSEVKATKHQLACWLAEKFPNELADRLPPKRKPWQGEDGRIKIFEAVALALACQKSISSPFV